MAELALVKKRQVVSPNLRKRLDNRIMKENDVTEEMAERIVGETFNFLYLCASYPKRRFSPSPLVDIGWHTFLMYTKDYMEFCNLVAGRFIHHEPNDNPEAEMKTGGAITTVSFMKERAIPFDDGLWEDALAGDCTVDCDDGKGPDINCTCS